MNVTRDELRLAETVAMNCHRVCLCGSTRHLASFLRWNSILSRHGVVVLSIGCVLGDKDGSDRSLGEELDRVHRRKIDMCDAILVLDVDGYEGRSTRSEVAYARRRGAGVYRLTDYDCDQEWPLEDALFESLRVALGVRYSEDHGYVATAGVDR